MTYIISETHHYYGPSSKTGIVQTHDGRDAEFPTRAAAKAHVGMLEDGDYRLDHNEIGRPSYRIRKLA